MEDDDEFGDLYSDVITPFSNTSAFQPHQHPYRSEPAPPPIENTPAAAAAAAASTVSSDGSDMLSAPSNSDSRFNLNINLNLIPMLNLNRSPSVQTHENGTSPSRFSQDPPLLDNHEFRGVSVNSSSVALHFEAAETRVLGNLDFDSSTDVAGAKQEGDRELDQSAASEDVDIVSKVDNWGGQVEQEDDGPVIPGISIGQPNEGSLNSNGVSQVEANDQGDDWESDSDDDLQIVLNGNGHPDIHQYQGPVGMAENGGKVVDDDDDEDEDGEPLVIVSDTDAVHHPPPEEQGWGEDAGQAPDGEGKETIEAAKANGGVSLPPKAGYNNFGYHPYHSQFKYVRPGAAPLPGGSGSAGQVRPPVSLGVVGGRGRGDWRQAGMKGLQKGFQSGFWGNNASGRGFGGDFILPSQKTIFDINIDSFEEKPWNHAGIDVSDFFNFGLNEDSWKEYCKKLEHLRMESSMKSKAHVLVVGSQPDQEYDPDLPPELAAAAAGFQDPSIENSNAQRADVGQSNIAKGTAFMPPPLPTGRPIQVETGSGERLPSIDTRPPRMRDPDSVIEIVLQGSVDEDTSAGYGASDQPNNDVAGEDLRDDAVEEDDEQLGNEYSDRIQQSLDRTKRKDNPGRFSQVNASDDNILEDRSTLPPPEAPVGQSAGSRENSSLYPSDAFEASHEERRMEGEVHERLCSPSPAGSTLDDRFADDKKEESNESMRGKDSPHGLSFEERVVSDDELQTGGNYQKENEDVNSSFTVSSNNTVDTSKHHSPKMLKLGAQVDHMAAKETDEMDYAKAARSSDNSRATGSSLDLQKGYNVANKEGIQDEHTSHARDLKRNHREGVNYHHRKDRDGSLGTEKNNVLAKRRESSYPHRDFDPYLPHNSYVKSEGFDRRRERDYSDGMLQLRGEDPHGSFYRSEDSRKHEHADGMIARQRGKVRESERSNKDEHLPPRKVLENGNWRGHYEKEAGFRMKEKDDILKSRYENMDDPHSKRRKDDQHARRDHFDKDETYRTHRENSCHRKRERDESLDLRKRDDHRSTRSKDESWLQRERVEQRHKEKDDGYHTKQSYEESLSRREREDGRAPIRSGRNVEDKGRMGHSRKDDYKGYERDSSYKDIGRNIEPIKRKDRVEDASSLQYGYEEKRSRQEKPTSRSDHAVHASDNKKVHERRPKENGRKPKQVEGGQLRTSNSFKKSQEERSDRNEMAAFIGTTEEGNPELGISSQLQTTRGKLEDASDDDERHRSKRGRSKLERWASHEERDYSGNNKPSSSLKFEAEKGKNPGAGHPAKVTSNPPKKAQAVDIIHSTSEMKESGVQKEKEPGTKHTENQHLDTVAKLKKRSERFKLPMPVEKETTVIKKMESEPLSSAPGEPPANPEIKLERPPRKRRWISN